MSDIVKWTPNIAVSRRIEEALELVNTNLPAVRQEPRHGLRPISSSTGPVLQPAPASPQLVAMPRVCALVDKAYASYYVLGEGGRYRYTRSGQVNKAVFRELFSGVGVSSYKLRSVDIDEETCPWCGTSGRGGIYCQVCKSFVCWGSVIDNHLFRCRCGDSGELSKTTIDNIGVVPRKG
jgi:hypothetical protein